MVVTLWGITTDASEEHLSKVLSFMIVILSGILIDTNEVQSENAYRSIKLILFGIAIDAKDEHPSKALFLIVVRPSGISIVTNDVQW
jgi:hypothetical protein